MPVVEQEFIEQYPLVELRPHPKNPRQHDQATIDEAIRELGFNGAILVQTSTGFILDGHGRVEALRKQGAVSVPAFMLDVNDLQAEKIMLARNRVGERSGYDEDLLAELLTSFTDADDLLGTGFTVDDVDDLLGSYEEHEDEPRASRERQPAPRSDHPVGLRQVVLVYTDEDYDQLTDAVSFVAEFADVTSISAAILHGVVNYAKELAADLEV